MEIGFFLVELEFPKPALSDLRHKGADKRSHDLRAQRRKSAICANIFVLRKILSKKRTWLQSNLGLTDKCGPTTVRCWKKSVKRKRSVPHSVTIVCTSTANIAYHNASKRGIIMSLRQRSTISRFVGYWFSLVTITCTAVYAYGTVKSEVR